MTLSRILLILVFTFSALFVYSQTNEPNKFSSKLQLTNLQTPVENIEQKVKSFSGDDDIGIQLKRNDISPKKLEHKRFVVYKNGIPVEGSTILTHGKNGQVQQMNGYLPQNSEFSGASILSQQEAIDVAMNVHEGQVYAWEDAQAEKTLKDVRNNPSATFYPAPDLVYYDPQFPRSKESFRLAYKFELYSLKPLSRKEYYIDAEHGTILDTLEQIHTTNNVEATAETKYSGTRTITTDSIGPNHYELNATNRGNGIETLNMRTSFFYDYAEPFTDSNNVWDHFNEDQDEIATDAQWGMEMTYDYYSQRHNWKSYDNDDAKMVAYVHYGHNYVNAFWNGNWTTYGDGTGPYDPLTSVDVVGHEFTHGVIDYTADLRYRNEPGALNESFCDIFGNCIEYFAKPENFSWGVGEDFVNNGLRSMSNPKSQGDPDTYKGQNWITGNFDNGGVHSNSGVQNKWFYLLVEGGQGVNDNGDTFSVDGIGMDSAAAIAFYNLRYYLSRYSQYDDARWGSIHATQELYGEQSPAIASVMDAWYAVGLGQPAGQYDIDLTSLVEPANNRCQLANNEPIRLQMTLNSINDTIFMGDSIQIGYQLAGDSVTTQHVVLEDTLFPFDRLTTDTLGLLDLAAPGKKNFKIFVHYPKDGNAANDTFNIQFNTSQHQTVNIGIHRLFVNSNGCLNPDGDDVTIRLRYYGCDSLTPAAIPVSYTIDGQNPVFDTVHIEEALYPGQNYNFTFSKKIHPPAMGQYTVDVNIDYPLDTINANNNSESTQITRAFTYEPGNRITFESLSTSIDSLYTTTNRDAGIDVLPLASSKGFGGLLMTGGDIIQDRHRYTIPDSNNIWNNNGSHQAMACVCVDAREYEPPLDVQFDLKQTYSPYHQLLVKQEMPMASSMRVRVNGEQVSPTYWPQSYEDDEPTTHTLSLDSFANQWFELCFETRNFISYQSDISNDGRGDNAYVDHILLMPQIVGTDGNETISLDLGLYPNPVKDGQLQIRLKNDGAISSIQIFGADGREYSAKLQPDNNSIDVKHLPAGYYLLKVRGNENSGVAKFAVMK